MQSVGIEPDVINLALPPSTFLENLNRIPEHMSIRVPGMHVKQGDLHRYNLDIIYGHTRNNLTVI